MPSYWKTTRIVKGVHIFFEWHGGEYIEVGLVGHNAIEVINVWDVETNAPRIERNRRAFLGQVDEWIKEYGPENLAHDARENWIYC